MTVSQVRTDATAGSAVVGRQSAGSARKPGRAASAGASEARRANAAEAETARGGANQPEPGIFTISLDFELYWGMHDHTSLTDCEQRLLGTRRAIPFMLDRFAAAGVHATWATVGLLFHENAVQARAGRPHLLPHYSNVGLSPYERDELLPADADERGSPGIFAHSLIERIRQTPHQEVGSHTYSHYYCLEPGQSLAAFEADLRQAVEAAAHQGILLKSLVFPRNQYSLDHVAVAMQVGFKVVRCQQDQWLYRPRNRSQENLGIRMLRLLDSYLPLSGSNVVHPSLIDQGDIVCLPDSRFLRPYSPKLALLDGLRMHRIKRSMTRAARTGGIYHLWWHPHNFGTHLDKNLAQLDKLLAHYTMLEKRYGFTSQTMTEIAERVRTPALAHTRGEDSDEYRQAMSMSG